MFAIVLPGVTIADGVVVGAGRVVNRNLDANCLYVGNPTDKVRVLES